MIFSCSFWTLWDKFPLYWSCNIRILLKKDHVLHNNLNFFLFIQNDNFFSRQWIWAIEKSIKTISKILDFLTQCTSKSCMPVENFKLLTSLVFKLLRFKKCLSIFELIKWSKIWLPQRYSKSHISKTAYSYDLIFSGYVQFN